MGTKIRGAHCGQLSFMGDDHPPAQNRAGANTIRVHLLSNTMADFSVRLDFVPCEISTFRCTYLKMRWASSCAIR